MQQDKTIGGKCIQRENTMAARGTTGRMIASRKHDRNNDMKDRQGYQRFNQQRVAPGTRRGFWSPGPLAGARPVTCSGTRRVPPTSLGTLLANASRGGLCANPSLSKSRTGRFRRVFTKQLKARIQERFTGPRRVVRGLLNDTSKSNAKQ